MRKNTQRIRLNRETLLLLEHRNLKHVAGATLAACTATRCGSECGTTCTIGICCPP